MLTFPQSEYQTRQRRQETGQRVVLQLHGRSHHCHGAAVVRSQVSCLTKMDFPWSNTLQNWSHILVFSSSVGLKDILTSALSGAQISLHIAPAPLLATGCKIGDAYTGISPTPPMEGTMWISSLKISSWDTVREAWSCKQQGLGKHQP